MFDLIHGGSRPTLLLKKSAPGLQGCATNTDKVQERITVAFLRILAFFITHEKNFYCGSDVMKQLNLPSGTIYPLLIRMTRAGWLNRELEDVNPKEVGRPAKRFYRISSTGLKEGKKLISAQRIPITADELVGNMEAA
jgi:hypothetical protein